MLNCVNEFVVQSGVSSDKIYDLDYDPPDALGSIKHAR